MVASVRRFEDLIAWRKAQELTRAVYQITGTQAFRDDHVLCRQIRRAAVSVMSNIAEGFDRGGRAEFHRFLVTAKGSCAEVRSHLHVARDAGYIADDVFDTIKGQTEEISRIVGGLRAAVARQRDSARS